MKLYFLVLSDVNSIPVSDVVDMADKLTLSYYAAIGIVITVAVLILGINLFDRNNFENKIKAEYRKYIADELEQSKADLRKQFNEKIKELEDNFDVALSQKLEELQRTFQTNILNVRKISNIQIKFVNFISQFESIASLILVTDVTPDKLVVFSNRQVKISKVYLSNFEDNTFKNKIRFEEFDRVEKRLKNFFELVYKKLSKTENSAEFRNQISNLEKEFEEYLNKLKQ